ncbi:MAG: serine/threonine-protein kinase [Planctomycetota bacterium]
MTRMPSERDPLAQAREVDQACDRFEADIQAGRKPAIEDYLERASAEISDRLFRELLLIELEFLPPKPPAALLEELHARFPARADQFHAIVRELHSHSTGQSSHSGICSGIGWDSSPENPPSVPGYANLRFLGSGGMGMVYHAQQESTGREVALKIIHPLASDWGKRKELFLREAEILRTLDHPRIVRFLDVGSTGSLWFLAMEYVPAIDLRELLAKQPVSKRIRAWCGIAFQTLDGLAYAHDRSYVHRDIKPSNILVVREGRALSAKIADFGLAKNYRLAGLSGITHLRDFRGTLAYMAPEQLLNSRDAQPQADIYALGATLYRWLSGKHPFETADEGEFYEAKLKGRSISLQELCPDVPRGLAAVVEKAMSRLPKNRFPTARAMRQEILPFAQDSR